MVSKHESYIGILKEIYIFRKNADPAYSIKQFSTDCGFKSYHMSDVMSGRYGLSTKRAVSIAEKLQMSDKVKSKFIRLVQNSSMKSNIDKDRSAKESDTFSYYSDKNLTAQEYSLFSDWHFFAILEMVRKSESHLNKEIIAQALGLDIETCEKSLQLLVAKNYLKYDNEKLSVTHDMISFINDVPSEDLRKYHRTMISKSLDSMTKDPVDKRFFSSFDLNLSVSDYKNFHEELCAFIRKKIATYQNNPQEQKRLYATNLQIFPLEKEVP